MYAAFRLDIVWAGTVEDRGKYSVLSRKEGARRHTGSAAEEGYRTTTRGEGRRQRHSKLIIRGGIIASISGGGHVNIGEVFDRGNRGEGRIWAKRAEGCLGLYLDILQGTRGTGPKGKKVNSVGVGEGNGGLHTESGGGVSGSTDELRAGQYRV